MFNVFSYFYSSPSEKNESSTSSSSLAVVGQESLNPLLENPPTKYSHVDAHLLIWDLHHLSYHDLEEKYRAKHLTLCNLLKIHGYPVFQTPISTDVVETILIKVPQELHFVK